LARDPEQPSRAEDRGPAAWLLAALGNVLLLTLPSLLLLFVALEIVFRWVIPAAEMPVRYFDPVENIVRFDTNGPREGLFTRGRFAELRGRWRVNNYGWNSDVDYFPTPRASREKPLIAIIGDSYVNGFQVDPEENVGAVLRDLLGGEVDVYRFAIPGAPLSHYLHMSRYVNRQFDPDVVLFVIVHNDFHLSLRELDPRPYYLQLGRENGKLVEIAPVAPESEGSPLWSKIATGRYLKTTLQSHLLDGSLRGPESRAFIANVPVDEVDSQRASIEEGTRLLVDRIREENSNRTVVFVMDAPRLDLYAGALESSRVRWLNELLGVTCRDRGIPFVDLSEPFSEVFRRTGQHFESSIDAHWNEVGHREAARAIAAKLAELGLARPPS
jgi:hypothetical protein